jgi:hypothetical protein
MKKPPIHSARLGALAAVLGSTLWACQGPESSVSPSSSVSQARAALSPEAARGLSQLESMLRRPSQGLPQTSDAQERVALDLQGGFQHAMIAQQNTDGSQSVICTDSIDRAVEFFTRLPQNQLVEER